MVQAKPRSSNTPSTKPPKGKHYDSHNKHTFTTEEKNMTGINKAIIIGNVGNEPKGGVMANGSSVCNFSVATSEKWKDKQTGQQQERTEWHKVTVFGKLAEVANSYVTKGCKIYVEGKLRTRKWNKDGVDHYVTEIMADAFQLLSPVSSKAQHTGSQGDRMGAGFQQPDPDQGIDFDDDIPF
jgi:single-strand DNA-binding protein